MKFECVLLRSRNLFFNLIHLSGSSRLATRWNSSIYQTSSHLRFRVSSFLIHSSKCCSNETWSVVLFWIWSTINMLRSSFPISETVNRIISGLLRTTTSMAFCWISHSSFERGHAVSNNTHSMQQGTWNLADLWFVNYGEEIHYVTGCSWQTCCMDIIRLIQTTKQFDIKLVICISIGCFIFNLSNELVT